MCYDIKASLEAQLLKARRKGDEQAVKEIMEKLIPLTDLPIYHASGFQHPKLLIYTGKSPDIPIVANWGLIPHWVSDKAQATKLWNNTLNARGETIFEKPAFREAAHHQRCLIYVDGFFEHHHFKKGTYPYFIHHKEDKPLILGGLFSEWLDEETGELLTTFTIVTTEGNELLSSIHNNPKQNGPRMPLILTEELAARWLEPLNDELDVQLLKEQIQSFPAEELQAYTVQKLRGKAYLGNVASITEPVTYPELTKPLNLFGD